jgi:hypothetical protein
MTTITIDDNLYQQAKMQAKAQQRSIRQQIEWWAIVGKASLENPDLPIDFIHDLLIANAEDDALATPFIPEGKRDRG